MNRTIRFFAGAALALAVLGTVGCAGLPGGHKVNLSLSGSEEVPPVQSAASGSGTIHVAADRSVSGRITTTGVNGTAAHIHQAARGQNGAVAVALDKDGDHAWMVPAGAKLSEAQYDAFKAGNLYVNVHSPANKGGEIRAQLKP